VLLPFVVVAVAVCDAMLLFVEELELTYRSIIHCFRCYFSAVCYDVDVDADVDAGVTGCMCLCISESKIKGR
jgi:hypothetical protein